MTTRTVTGNTILLTGSAQASQTVTFKKKSATISGTVITQQGVTTATTDAYGNFSKALDCPVSGSTSWALICPDGSLFDFDLPYGDGSSVAVTTLITAGVVEADDVTLLLDGYVLKSGSTMTGQLSFSGSTHAGLKLLTLTTTQRDALTPANGMVIYNSTTATVQVYQGGAWASVGSGGAVSSVFGRTGAVVAAANDYAASEIEDDSQMAKASVAAALNTLDTSIANLSNNKQDASTKLSAIDALTWAANSIIWLTGTATASVQALASHIVTFLQSANAAAARSAIGAGTGNGDVTGPGSSTDNAIARFDSTTGKIIQNSAATVDDSGNVYAATTMGINSSGFVGYSGNQLRLATGSAWFQIAFYTDSAVKMLLDINGQLGIGTTSPQGKLHSYQTAGGFLHAYKSGVTGSATTVIPDAAGDVTLALSGTFTISDGAGNTAGGVITKTVPGGTFNLYDDGGTNTCQLQISAGGAVTVIRTAGSRTYAVNLTLNWM